jgi:hypothetical protein
VPCGNLIVTVPLYVSGYTGRHGCLAALGRVNAQGLCERGRIL